MTGRDKLLWWAIGLLWVVDITFSVWRWLRPDEFLRIFHRYMWGG